MLMFMHHPNGEPKKRKSNLPQNSRPRRSRDSRCKKFSAGRIYEQSQMKDNVLQKSGFAAAFASLLPLWHVLPLVVQSDVSISITPPTGYLIWSLSNHAPNLSVFRCI
jgi:hypothetical protein